MKKFVGVAVGALLAFGAAQPAFAGDAVGALSTFLGEEVTFTSRIASFELYWVDDPTTIAIGDPAPINWAIGLDLGTAAPFDEKFALLTGIGGGGSVVVCPAFCGGFAGAVLDDITGTDLAAFAAYIGAGPGTTNLAVFGVGEIQSITGVTSGVTLDYSNIPNPAGDIASQLTFTLNGLPISGLIGSPTLGTVTTAFGVILSTAHLRFTAVGRGKSISSAIFFRRAFDNDNRNIVRFFQRVYQFGEIFRAPLLRSPSAGMDDRERLPGSALDRRVSRMWVRRGGVCTVGLPTRYCYFLSLSVHSIGSISFGGI